MAAIDKQQSNARTGKRLGPSPQRDRRAGDGPDIDLDRLVYDPEYRARVRRELDRREAEGEG